MKLEFDTNPSDIVVSENNLVSDIKLDDLTPVTTRIRAGIQAARDGHRAEARSLLLSAVELQPTNEKAWMWLASISEYPEELLGYLSNVLKINPANERALEWAKSTKSLLADTFVQRGMDASRENRTEMARNSFLEAVAHDGENEKAWLGLAFVAKSAEEKTAHLKKVLSFNPQNEDALSQLQSTKKNMNNELFQKAAAAAVADDYHSANKLLGELLVKSPGFEDAWILKSFMAQSFSEKTACFEKILDLDADNQFAQAGLISLSAIMSEAAAASGNASEFSGAADENLVDLQLFDEAEQPDTPPLSPNARVSDFSSQDFNLNETDQNDEFQLEMPDEEVAEFAAEIKFDTPEDTANYAFSAAEFHSQVMFDEETAVEKAAHPVEDAAVAFAGAETVYADYSNEEFSDFRAENAEPTNFFENNESSSENNLHTAVSEEFSSYYKAQEENEVETAFAPAAAAESNYAAPAENVEPVFSQENQTAEELFRGEDADPVFAAEEQTDSAEENDWDNEYKPPTTLVNCPFCAAENEPQAFVCHSCRAMLTLSDLEMLLANQEADKETLRQSVEKMEAENEEHGLNADRLKILGIGHINLKNLRLGFAYLQDAVKLNPNNVVLSSQVNALAIRLAEIEQQENIHSSMPKNRKILVVDDSATVRKLITSKLEKSGHEVVCAVDGIEALEKINEIVPDLILLDINMPRMDGYQVCKLIRNNEATKEVPVVMISGKDGFFDKVRGRMAGTTGYITKPFGPETLMKTVETYIV